MKQLLTILFWITLAFAIITFITGFEQTIEALNASSKYGFHITLGLIIGKLGFFIIAYIFYIIKNKIK